MKASCGTSTLPMSFIRFFPAACFFSNFFLRLRRGWGWGWGGMMGGCVGGRAGGRV